LDLNFGSVFFQLLKFIMPGASFAKDFGVRLYFHAAFAGLRLKDNAIDEKIQAAAYGTLHRFPPLLDKTKIRSTKSEIRKKIEAYSAASCGEYARYCGPKIRFLKPY
jgi:hypothetical protein